MEETILYTKYALLSPSEYLKLNEAISERLGFNLNESTERYTSMTSQFTTEGLMIMEITTEVQEKCADLLEGLTLVDNGQWVLAEEQPTMIEATGLTTEQIDWALVHMAITKPDIEVLYLLDGVPSNEQAIQDCVNEGISVIISQ